jgi:lysophospholipase L1-like esterase
MSLMLGLSLSITNQLGGGGSSPGETTNILVANRFQIATNVGSITANLTSRRMHYASSEGEIYDFHCVDSGLYLNAGVPTGAGARTIKRYLEYPEGVFHQVTWAGATTRALATGAVDSDTVISSVTGQPLRIPAGTKFWERTVNLGGTVANFPRIELPDTSQNLGVDDGNDVTDKGNSGTIPPSSIVYTFGMAGLVGKIAKANAKAFVVYGDSISFGTGDITGIGAKGSSGYVARLLDKYGYPYFKMAQGGWQASQAAVNTASPIALLDNIPAPIFLNQLGINDLRLGRTKAQIEADYQTIYGLPVAAGLSPSIMQTTITPRSDSSNAYADVAGQTPKTDGNMADLTPLNTDIRAGLANVTTVLESADAAMSARDSNVWSGPFPPVTDGTHPTSAKADAMATALSI